VQGREDGEGADLLLTAHAGLYQGLVELGVALSELAEHLDTLPTRGVQRIRRTLDILRADLDEAAAGVEAWIPRGERGEPLFRDETFYDVETTPRGFDVLAARVLLPHEHLGRHYYPELSGAVLISATTWLKGGFDAQARYLGCRRAAQPADDEERDPTPLATFRAPDAFDYGRVLVCAPRDAPAPNAGKRAALEYVARFACYLGERTRGRILVLFTNADDCAQTARLAEPFFAARRIPFWHQRMEGTVKEELGERFRATVDSVMFGLDTFWYGADFPGETLEHLVLARLPYGVPDRYHHAQCAVLGAPEQRKTIYMPRALAKFRQGFGRLMRKETDRGCVYLLDPRVLDPRHRAFLRELPLALPELEPSDASPETGGARLVRGDADRCLHEAFAHMGLLADVKRRGLDQPFGGWRPDRSAGARGVAERPEIPESELPY
jgi:Rad3-related DNA helicase